MVIFYRDENIKERLHFFNGTGVFFSSFLLKGKKTRSLWAGGIMMFLRGGYFPSPTLE